MLYRCSTRRRAHALDTVGHHSRASKGLPTVIGIHLPYMVYSPTLHRATRRANVAPSRKYRDSKGFRAVRRASSSARILR